VFLIVETISFTLVFFTDRIVKQRYFITTAIYFIIFIDTSFFLV